MFTCIAQVSRSSTVVRPWELSPVVSTHQRPLVPNFRDFAPTATASVHPGPAADHVDSGYCSPEPVSDRRSSVRSSRLVCRKSFSGLTVTEHFSSKDKGSPYSITERRVPELIPVLDSQPAGDVSHKPGGRLPLLSAMPAVIPATLKGAATNFAAW